MLHKCTDNSNSRELIKLQFQRKLHVQCEVWHHTSSSAKAPLCLATSAPHIHSISGPQKQGGFGVSLPPLGGEPTTALCGRLGMYWCTKDRGDSSGPTRAQVLAQPGLDDKHSVDEGYGERQSGLRLSLLLFCITPGCRTSRCDRHVEYRAPMTARHVLRVYGGATGRIGFRRG